MNYSTFIDKSSFDKSELLAFAYGRLVDDPPQDFDARLPAPPFLMVDRITSITREKRGGIIIAEQDIALDAWYFQCHMPGDPVQPGCLCVDAVWQLLGFYCVWHGACGAGRALGCENVVFNGQIRPYNRVVRYEITIRRYSELKDAGASIALGDGTVFVDDEQIMTIERARTGVFKGITYADYPHPSRNSRGGTITESKERS